MKPTKKPEAFMRSPSFPGGAKAMDTFVKYHLKYPEEAIRMKIAGKVAIVADIDYKGKVIKTVVKKGIGFGCDQEAARVVGMMSFESIKFRGLRVVFHKTITIHFTLPDAPEINPEVTYTYVVEKKNTQEKTYSYKIGNPD